MTEPSDPNSRNFPTYDQHRVVKAPTHRMLGVFLMAHAAFHVLNSVVRLTDTVLDL